MNIAILGKSASGKDTYISRAVKELPQANKIIYCTTRPIRPTEQCGVDYKFMSDEEFEMFKEKGLFASYYETINSLDNTVWKYAYLISDLQKDGINLMVVNPHDYHQLKKYIHKTIYLDCDLVTRIERSLDRVELTRSNINEILRRAKADEIDFKNVSYNIKLYTDLDRYKVFKDYIQYQERKFNNGKKE